MSFGDFEKDPNNWARMSPRAREAHNRLRQMKGMETLAPPKVDLYVAPPRSHIVPINFEDPEFKAATREFIGGVMGSRLDEEGFSINGRQVDLEQLGRNSRREMQRMEPDEGFRGPRGA